MDVVENQHYITKWVEDNVINGVKHLRHRKGADDSRAENIIQNGVKEAKPMEGWVNSEKIVDKTIQNGVKETELHKGNRPLVINDTIQNGVKETRWMSDWLDNKVENTIQNGVKHTEYGDWLDGDERLDDIIDNGVKETTPGGYLGSVEMKGKTVHQFEHAKQDNDVEDVIKSGVKECIPARHPLYNPMDFLFNIVKTID